MNSELSNNQKTETNKTEAKCDFKAIKNDYFLMKVFNNLQKKNSLEMAKYNKKIKKRLNLNINDYKEYCEIYSSIEIELIPVNDKFGKFININEKNSLYYHIYFNNNNKEETKRNYLKKNEKVNKINIIIDYQVESLFVLFKDCVCIESINFKKFYRNNIINLSWMFCKCSSLKEINLSNFNTNNVTDMQGMFYGCSSLEEINLPNFNTNNVKDMGYMFYGCSSLKEINLSNFNTNNVTDMSGMFLKCSSLKEINLSNFNTNNVSNMRGMFGGCSDEIKKKIKEQIKNIKEEAL